MLFESGIGSDFPAAMCGQCIRVAQETDAEPSKELYFLLLDHHVAEHALESSRQYLAQQLRAADRLQADLPAAPHELPDWIDRHIAHIGQQYHDYLARRKAGAPRQYFSNKSHALNFLQSVAPTKLVDGSWLYGLVRHWDDMRFTPLIRIYLEELGEGMPTRNHVLLYRKLLATHGCEQWRRLSDNHFVQGAIQLSLAYNADQFLPEVIGFNLGYEQLPLHLLITAYELNELDIDPYYFTLHVTIDNASTGHARKSVEGLLHAIPLLADAEDFYRRVINGYKLNMLGASTNSVIAEFDLEQELVNILTAKSQVGQHAHSDFCRIEGRTVNQWLTSGQIAGFLEALQHKGWIKRHQDPVNSRFWHLIEGDKAEMFGVFSAYEKQVIYDWIAGDSTKSPAPQATPGKVHSIAAAPRQLSYKVRQRLLNSVMSCSEESIAEDSYENDDSEFNADIQLLNQQLAMLANKQQAMQYLADLLSPATHHTPAGLMATRKFSGMLDNA